MRYLLSDPLPVGIVTWVASVFTIVALLIAIAQISQVKKAANAAKQAADEVKALVRREEQSASLIEAISSLSSALSALKGHNSEASAAYLTFGWNALVYARELTIVAADREQITNFAVAARRLRDDCKSLSRETLFSPEFLRQQTSELARVLGSLEELSARIRLSLVGLK